MEITAKDVKKLRDKTGAGMMDCKKALTEAGGDFAGAERILKEMGLAAAQKRAGRATDEGRVFTRVSGKQAGILELSCETDFVARNKDFMALGGSMLTRMLDEGLDEKSEAVQSMLQEAIGTIKENMGVSRFARMTADDDELIVDYVHGDGGGIGVLAKIKTGSPDLLDDEKVKAFAFDIALHVAAFNPPYLSVDTVPEQYKEEQRAIYKKQAESMGKPEKVVDGIVQGKMKKHLAEIALEEQPFVKDDKRSVKQVAEDIGKEIGTTVQVADFIYFRVGDESGSE
ncbi:MAG: translation elongation factor Ts [Spirochaetota bacterium]